MRSTSTPIGRRPAAGFTMIELMVALVVGMVVVLSVVAVQKAFEGQRRTSTSGNDIDNAGTYVLSQIDGMMRSAGSGFTQAYAQTYGCALNAASGGGTLLPLPAGFNTGGPFAGVPGALGGPVRLAPVVILPGATPATHLNGGNGSSDVVMVMSGAGYAANLQTNFKGAPAAGSLTLESTAAFSGGDLILVMDAASPTGPAACGIQQVAAGFVGGAGVTNLPLGGSYYSTSPLSPATFSVDGAAVAIGNLGKGSFPGFQLLGVGSGNQLYSYDLLNIQGTPLLPIGDSVMELHAVYLTTTGAGNGFVGVAPNGAFAPAALMAGTFAAGTNLNNIKAVRIGLILKSPLLERPINGAHVAPAALNLFQGLNDATGTPMTYTRALSAATCDAGAAVPVMTCELDYRYRTFELTIPLRNPLIN